MIDKLGLKLFDFIDKKYHQAKLLKSLSEESHSTLSINLISLMLANSFKIPSIASLV